MNISGKERKRRDISTEKFAMRLISGEFPSIGPPRSGSALEYLNQEPDDVNEPPQPDLPESSDPDGGDSPVPIGPEPADPDPSPSSAPDVETTESATATYVLVLVVFLH